MKTVVAVARRELLEHRILLPAALAAGLLPFAVTQVRGIHGLAAKEVQYFSAYLIAAAFAAGLALALGTSLVGRELSAHRLGFYFSRPVSGAALWAGKFAGGALLVLAAALLAIAPVWLVGGGGLSLPDLALPSLTAVLAAALILLPVSHALGVAFRSRSPLLGLDLFATAAAVLIASTAARALTDEMAGDALRWGMAFVGALTAVAFIAAGLASICAGRTDLARAHRALSTVLWSAVLSGALLFAAYSRWVLLAAPSDLAEVSEAQAAPAGSWVHVSGRARLRGDYAPGFLLDTSSGRWHRIGSPRFTSPVFSRDGSRIAWLEGVPGKSPFNLVSLASGDPSARPVATKLFFSSAWLPMALSPDGERLAVLEAPEKTAALLVSVYEPASGRMLASAPFPVRAMPRLLFPTPDLLRIYVTTHSSRTLQNEATAQGRRAAGPAGAQRSEILIFEFRVKEKRLEQTGQLGPYEGVLLFRTNASGDRLLVHEMQNRKIALCDVRSGGVLAIFESSRRAQFLADGRIAVAAASAAGSNIRLFSDGREEKTIDLGPWRSVILGGETKAGEILAAVRPEPTAPWADATLLLVNPSTGAVRRGGDHLFPVLGHGWWAAANPSFEHRPGSEASKLFFAPHGALVRFDPATGERRAIVAGKERP